MGAKHLTNFVPRTSAKAMLKLIPGLVAVVRHLRALWRNIQIAVTRGVIAWGTGTNTRRLMIFEALSDRLLLAAHKQESYVVNASDKVIGRSLYVRGQFDFQKFEVAYDLIRSRVGLSSDAILVDAGANVGSICIPAVRRGLVERAIAFELDPENSRLLKINALLNGVEELVDIRNVAVGAAPCEVMVKHSGSNFGDHRVLEQDDEQGMTVPMVQLDSIAKELDLSRTILWMDIQGYEAFALQGAKRFMEAGVPLIAEFSYEELESTGSFDTFLSLVTGASFTVFYDLNAPQPEPITLSRAALEMLSDQLRQQGTFTDLLFLPA